MLLEAGRPQEALVEYEASLRSDPNRFNGLYGAARAAAMTEQKEKAARYYAQLVKNCEAVRSDRPELSEANNSARRQIGGHAILQRVVEMHYPWTTPVKLDDTRLRQLLPNLHNTPYTHGIRATIDAMRTRAVPAAA
jgi:tetratricopeptide (TPR) repeat protein